MEEKRLTRTQRTYLRQHRKCVDVRFKCGFKAVNNKPYTEYCTWFSLYNWFIGDKKNRTDEELKLMSKYKSGSDFANDYLVLDKNGKFEYIGVEKEDTPIKIKLNKNKYKIAEVQSFLNVSWVTVENYCKYNDIEIYDESVRYILKEDVEKLITWCNKYPKNERANLISKKTTFEKYGVEHVLQSKEIQNKAKITCKEHYGVEHPSQSKEVQDIFSQTNLIIYGVENPSQSQIIKDRKAETTMEHYGKENPFQVEEIIEQINTNKHPILGHYFYNGILFHSSQEIYFYIYHHDILKDDITRGKTFDYYVDGKKHKYFCDFLLNGENVEIKGRQLINRETMILHTFLHKIPLPEKTKCLKDNNVRIIIDDDEEIIRIAKIVEKQFPKLVASCRVRKNENEIEDENYEDEYNDYDITNTIFDM